VTDKQEKPDVLVTPDGEELDQSITGTMNLEPDGKSASKNPSRLTSLKFGIAGLLYLLKREKSIQFATVVTLNVIVVGIWLEMSSFAWALLVLALGAVWITESLNTAIEAAIDLETQDPHPMAKIGKDVASAASVIASLVFVVVVVLILLPRILDRLAVG
jgi:diacylglycerol kinase